MRTFDMGFAGPVHAARRDFAESIP